MITLIKKLISRPIDWVLYTMLNEKQRAFLSRLFTDRQKDMLRRMTRHSKKHAQKQKIKQLKHHLYNLGFTYRALSELESLYSTTDDSFIKRLAAWELTLWHANKYTSQGARQALEYLPAVIHGEKDKDQLRRAIIIKAECHDMLNENKEGKRAINELLSIQQHPDLYLAAANLEETIEERTKCINKAMDVYNLKPIRFSSNGDTVNYDQLRTEEVDRYIKNGPKVSVILPAYNAASGIPAAIESILSQTWQNIELLIVDDCSSDNTKDVIRGYMKKDSRITLLNTPVNSGAYVARNIALKVASGEYVTINDSDDWSHAQKIEIQVKHLMNNKKVIANTSEHARLTEELKLYRRGTPGRYIFSNMSSLMFRRELVFKKLGFWDSVRFAGDGEFKRRLIKVFGKASIVDMNTGPLSLPRQSATSLTGSSAFGYNGFFMGVRKEYVESLEFFYQKTETLYYPYPQKDRPFPVPEPMWPNRENKPSGNRFFDVIIASDFRVIHGHDHMVITEIHKQKTSGNSIGLIQMYYYDLEMNKEVSPLIRDLIDGDRIQMLVYGETSRTNVLYVMNPIILEDWQKYIPEVIPQDVHVIAEQLPLRVDIDRCINQLQTYFGRIGTWDSEDLEVQKYLQKYNWNKVDLTGRSRGEISGHVE